MDLPKNEKTFDFEHVGETTGRRYEGKFTVKCALSLGDKRNVEVEQSKLSVDLMNPTADLSAISRVIANLRVRVIDAPDWFTQSIYSLDIMDEEVMFELYGKAIEATKEWKDKLKEKSSEGDNPEGNSKEEVKS